MSKRELKKEAILLAGMGVMKSKGYNGTSVKDIVDAAGVPKGSFYNYFASKEQFALDAIDSVAEDARAYAKQALGDENQCAVQRLRAFFSSGIDCAAGNDFKVGCFLGNMCQEMADSSDVIRARLDQILNAKTRLIAQVIEQGQAQGSLSADMPALAAAEFLFNAWEGALMRAKAAKSRQPLDAFVLMLERILS
ncbi:TetR/AcrR family transcriptional regulator [Agaribacterium haliotis]|uniref:TetR/AcrR family transcriptional regulator n=1 Tax=Agaribacterium haliotis TaxID=2013869 RepID=UPI000BB52FB9|nr:TetR/AcrR family transcriptional regulator [Agaribacterium haliotis]